MARRRGSTGCLRDRSRSTSAQPAAAGPHRARTAARRNAALAERRSRSTASSRRSTRIDLPSVRRLERRPPRRWRSRSGATGLLERFEGRIFSAVRPSDGRGKPAPDLFLHAAERDGLRPGDDRGRSRTARPGVEAGIAAGHARLRLPRRRADARSSDMRELPEPARRMTREAARRASTPRGALVRRHRRDVAGRRRDRVRRAEAGATSVTGDRQLDAADGHARSSARRPVRFVQRRPARRRRRSTRSASHDVVWCSGVLYHAPHPLLTLERLRSITGADARARQRTIPRSSRFPQAASPRFADRSARDSRRLAARR